MDLSKQEGRLRGDYANCPEGIYPVEITATVVKPNGNIQVTGTVTSGHMKGKLFSKSLGVTSEGQWAIMMRACGVDLKKLTNFDPVRQHGNLLGKKAHVYYSPDKLLSGAQYDTIEFAGLDDCEIRHAAFLLAHGGQGAQTPAAPVVTTPPVIATPVPNVPATTEVLEGKVETASIPQPAERKNAKKKADAEDAPF